MNAAQIKQVFSQMKSADQRLGLKMAHAFLQKGGWEGWLQVELGLYLVDTHAHLGGITVEREKPGIYTGQQRPDLWIQVHNTMEATVVELKCESIWNAVNFVDAVRNDINKLKTLQGNYHRVAVAVSATETGNKELYRLLKDRGEPFYDLGDAAKIVVHAGDIT